MSNSKQIIQSVKDNLSGRWHEAFCVIILPIAAYLSLYMVLLAISCFVQTFLFEFLANLFLNSFVLFMVLPLSLGILRYFLKLFVSSDNANFADLFYYLSSKRVYLRSIRFALIILFKLFINAVICYLPLIIVALLNAPWFFSFMGSTPPVWAAGLTTITAYLNIIGLIMFVLLSLKMYLAPILFVADSNIMLLEALHLSSTIHKYSFARFFILSLKNIWLVLISLLGITMVYTIPMLVGGYVVHFKNELESFNKQFEVLQVNTFSAFAD